MRAKAVTLAFNWRVIYTFRVSQLPPEPPAEEPLPPSAGEVVVGDQETSADPTLRPRLPFWKRIGGEGLVISVALHGILLVVFAVWVIATITDTATTSLAW